MAVRPARSLLHPFPEPLPPYTPRQTGTFDTETSSIHSNAPSYVSAAPSYHSGPYHSNNRGNESATVVNNDNFARTNNEPSSTSVASESGSGSGSGLLSSQQYAPGFRGTPASSSLGSGLGRTGKLTTSHLQSLYNASDWVPVAGGLQARHYHNVARRRASQASQYDNLARSTLSLFQGLSEAMNSIDMSEIDSTSSALRSSPTANAIRASHNIRRSSPSILGSLLEESVVHPRSQSPQLMTSGRNASQTDLAELPVSPHEDPDLVGEAAAAMFRSQRLYITHQQLENYSVEALSINPLTGRPHQLPVTGRPLRYSSLITPRPAGLSTHAASPEGQDSRPSTAPSATTATGTAQTEYGEFSTPQLDRQMTVVPQQRSASHIQLDDDALCAQESKTWDFMLAQMADWEERERSWKKFKDDMDKKLSSSKLGMGLGWGSWSLSTGGKVKLKKAQFGHEKKWKRKVGLAS
ncbi:hypothetical protein GX48_02544 [Paracoccidioides brasiliensis]|nr:hypothetical protein GX48_02544 [Paracoccidioides brasiliensis]